MNDEETFADLYRSVLTALRGLGPSREASLAITKLEESAMWAACACSKVTLPIDAALGAKKPPKA